MKTFETPYVDVVKFSVADVITTSADDEEAPPAVFPCI